MSKDNNSNALVLVTKAITAPEFQQRFQTFLPPDVKRDQFTEVVLTAIQQNPEVLQADRETLYTACVSAAKRGLLPDKKEGAFVIFNTKVGDAWIKQVAFLPMVEGIIKELAKAGVLAYAESVYENDTPRFWNDDSGQHVTHEISPFGDRGARVGAYAVGTIMANGRSYVQAMGMADLEKVALSSKQAKTDKQGNKSRGGTWVSWPDRMEQKTVLHRLRKRIPVNGIQPSDSEDSEFEGQLGSSSLPYGKEQSIPEKLVQVPPQAPESGEKRPTALQKVVDSAPADDTPPAEDNNDDLI